MKNIAAVMPLLLPYVFVFRKVAFQADLDLYTCIRTGSVVIFDVVDLNLGNGFVESFVQATFEYLYFNPLSKNLGGKSNKCFINL